VGAFGDYFLMIDLHSHILSGLDDGAKTVDVSIEMARRYLDQGVVGVACTPHIFPGLYPNNRDTIGRAILELQDRLEQKAFPLKLVSGADNHIVPNFVPLLRAGELLAIGETRYVLVEPPHHVVPIRLEALFFEILQDGYVPILTHPERLTWIERDYAKIVTLAERGVWMQLTSGSLLGRFGKRARYWADKMLCEGLVHILATDAHNNSGRPPDLMQGRSAAEKLVGPRIAEELVALRPELVLSDAAPIGCEESYFADAFDRQGKDVYVEICPNGVHRSVIGRLRQFFS
jgi:protein-tyrosine phosphatase